MSQSPYPSVPSAPLSSSPRPTADSGTVVIDPVARVPSSRPVASATPRRRRSVESTLVLRNRQLDNLRAEVRKQYAAFRFRRFGSLVLWAGLGGAAVLLGAFLARGFDEEEATSGAQAQAVQAEAATVEAAAVPVVSRPAPARTESATATEPVPAPTAAAPAAPAPTTAPARTAATPRPQAKSRSGAAPAEPLTLDQLPTR